MVEPWPSKPVARVRFPSPAPQYGQAPVAQGIEHRTSNPSAAGSIPARRANRTQVMVGVAQLVRAPGCGPGGRGFDSHHSPHFYSREYKIKEQEPL